MDLVTLIKDVGFPITLVLVLLWERKKTEDRNHGEQERLATRLSKVEDYIRDELVNILNRAVTAIEKHEKCKLKNEKGSDDAKD